MPKYTNSSKPKVSEALNLFDIRDNYTLRRVFSTSPCPTLHEFHGEYKIKMLSWYLPDFSRWNHRKRIADGKGINIFWDDTTWGAFSVEYETISGVKYVAFKYSVRQNNFILRGIRDFVRRVTDGIYLGTFNYNIAGKPRFLGYFLMTRANRGRFIGKDKKCQNIPVPERKSPDRMHCPMF